ncbi:hypothetical protein TSUD_26060 [Trifolium subterraneum]|uniref:Reverse transcriptase domain-containing protein n=1 Tax=Trifolium subterraneum TaxID=3900 RepID=A0A2Z6NCL7_TRISU|nr:hypothetical protein TSUD_26060 [Trifolium subterraneum]
MNDATDQDRILQGNPWIFRNAWLVVKPWDREVDFHTIDFDHVPIWVQLWGLPPHCKTKQMGGSIGALMGKVAINTKNPILSGIHIGNPTDGTKWIDYSYEKLPQMCFKCGMIGHADNLCRNKALHLATLAPLGPWIRSTQYGRRKMDEREKKYFSNPSQAKNFGQYSPPVSADLLEKLAAMRVQSTHEPPQAQPKPWPNQQNTQQPDLHSMDISLQQAEAKGKKCSNAGAADGNNHKQHSTSKFTPTTSDKETKNEYKRKVRAFKKLMTTYTPDLIFLVETKLQNTQYTFLNNYKDTYSAHIVNCSLTGGGRAGGLAIIWNKCNLDLGYTGSIYTWTNRQEGEHLIKCRLDRFLATTDWTNRETFGTIPKRIKEAQHELNNLQQNPNPHIVHDQIIQKEKELDDLLEKEELRWSQKARTMWLTYGDKNTKFFHQEASQRRRKNHIDSIKDSVGNQHNEEDKIEEIFLQHFQQLFTSQQTHNIAETVYTAIKEMKSLAAPGPDGLPAKFYHTYWEIIGKDITKEVLHVLNNGGSPEAYNNTHICLIPKTNNPTTPSDFRPISFCNVTLKIITKTLANRLKIILPDIISQNQSAFVPRRLITDNIIIANEVFHYFQHTTRKTGLVGIKTDMAKAYNRIEWQFLKATLESMNFPQNMINTIIQCVSTVTFSILINGKPSRTFQPQRGIRQGDPLSPYLFILCADVLSAFITKAQTNHLIHGVKIAQGALEITHLLFAGDSLMFCRATEEETTHMKDLITMYEKASGQLVNYNKSELLFSRKIPQTTKLAIQNILPMPIVDHFEKYLGQPTFMGRSKNQTFNYIQDRVWKKLKEWKEKNLSFAGRSTLIKAVAQAIPTYVMSCFLLPKGLCKQMEKMMGRFWWGSNIDQKKIHWLNWKEIRKQKSLGFINLHAFNEALLAKQGWRIVTEPNSLMATMLKAKYFPHTQFLQASQGKRFSYVWQSIQKASWTLKKGSFWLVGNGDHINIWQDRWIHPHMGSTTWTPKPDSTNLTLVRDLIDHQNHCWKEQLVNQTFIPYEATQICKIPISTHMTEDTEDTICWQGTKDGNYSVKSGYNAIMEWATSNSEQPGQANQHTMKDTEWNKIWKLNNPPKQLHLIWRYLHNTLPVKANLITRGILCDTLCPRCNKSPETMEWNTLSLSVNGKKGIWLARNNKIFNNMDTPVQIANNKALQTLHSYQNTAVSLSISKPEHTLSTTRHNNSWSPPHRSYLKLNVDAHLNGDGHWGLSMVLSRGDGRCIGAVTKVMQGLNDATLAETQGLFEALNWIKTKGFSNIVIEMDAEVVVRAIQKRIFPRLRWGKLAKSCARDFDKDALLSINWVRRNGNKAAHELARWALYEPNMYWDENYPRCIHPHIQKDMGFVIHS